jgi:hypothetical protein
MYQKGLKMYGSVEELLPNTGKAPDLISGSTATTRQKASKEI